MKKITTLLAMYISISSFSQNDTVINTRIYKSYYSYSIGQPTKVVYKLYKGGGECNRKNEGFRFHNDTVLKHLTAGTSDYAVSGYDEGHMANAEDFAGDCTKEELTFRFYNCIPQTPALNRGIWKANEALLRKISQTDSLLITCGGVFTTSSKSVKLGSKLLIPTYCYKIATSLSTGKLIQCLLFENNKNPNCSPITLEELQLKINKTITK